MPDLGSARRRPADLWDQAESLAGRRGAPDRLDIVLLVPFFLISATIGEMVAMFVFPRAEGLATLTALLVTALGYSIFRERNNERFRMIEEAHAELLEVEERREATERAAPKAEHADPGAAAEPVEHLTMATSPGTNRTAQLIAAADKILALPDRTPSQIAKARRAKAILEQVQSARQRGNSMSPPVSPRSPSDSA
ncbi:hypothetical protein U879_03560 [Defluviimonas sp. 20V17]|uniref:Uncharacterized protein n=1 Tax=Allgaiera indica TaxID=765699 RepID=A0AAN5A148_9RHOB|nr:hypothetical protein [Allgaiera indica]KDB05048.1 hypothetical protein U879_03560 [Defluviimonas sp. 20V17]GHE05557.1 hypothetical protein GCM10008024_36880 [Allgaiera indica]SDX69589.1 hypothetical protein SAMN05444006_1253 [Allgaiera indica]